MFPTFVMVRLESFTSTNVEETTIIIKLKWAWLVIGSLWGWWDTHKSCLSTQIGREAIEEEGTMETCPRLFILQVYESFSRRLDSATGFKVNHGFRGTFYGSGTGWAHGNGSDGLTDGLKRRV